jgi:hypothetical protein
MPEPGYYYHYKHDPKGPVNNYAYFVLGAGHHTEDDCRPEDRFMQVYYPLYEAFVYTHGKMADLRPLDMALEHVVVDGREVPRFSRITDETVIEALKAERARMYPELFA